MVYRTTFNRGDKIEHGNARQCYFCSTFYVKKDRFDSHIKYCSGRPGIKYKGEIPLTAYADFETITPTDDYLDPENRQMFAVSYAIIFAFHPDLNLERAIIERSFGHSLEDLISINYLTAEQQQLINRKTVLQLRDAAINVSRRKSKIAILLMFNVELKFAGDILLKWFNAKIKSKYIELDPFMKLNYQRQIPIDWQEGKCVICRFPLSIEPKGLRFQESDMSYIDFTIRKEHAFLRNIYDVEDLKKSKNIATIESYQKAFECYVTVIKSMEDEIKCVENYDMIYDDTSGEFLEEACPAYSYDVENLIEEMKSFKIKNFKSKIPKFNLQIYAFSCDALMDSPHHKFDFKTVTTSNFFENLYRILNSKVHLHHSHATGKIFGYTHDFCNWKVRENQIGLSLIGHNFLGFDLFYMLKGYRSSCWGTNDFSIGGSNLTTINFANVGSQVEIIDTIKYYQSSLAAIASTATEGEKNMIKKLTIQFISRHTHFGPVWQDLNIVVKENILDIIAEDKEIIPYEKIVDMNSLDIVSEKKFFEPTEFYSALKQKAVSESDYESSKYVFENLKMKNLSDMNDLYNIQDVILLTEIIENRFEEMYKKYYYIIRKCNSASTLSGCIQRDLSKVILTLPTCNDHVEVFEKTLTGGFSSVNTRMGFDMEILLPNLKSSDFNKMNIDGSFRSFKNQNFKVGYELKLDGKTNIRI